MKYKLIQIEKYLLAIEESKVTEGDYGLGFAEGIKGIGRGYSLFFHDGSNKAKVNTIAENTYKVVAHLPLNNSPILEGVDLLPALTVDDDTPKLSEEYYGIGFIDGFESGFKAAKEKYKWTDEDVIKIVEKSRETGLTAEYLLLSLSQPKYPVAFECEEKVSSDSMYVNFIVYEQKTTINSQGQIVWIGKYIY